MEYIPAFLCLPKAATARGYWFLPFFRVLRPRTYYLSYIQL
jgi:hypothetical protein